MSKSVRFKSRVIIGQLPTGKPIVKWATGATREEMEARRAIIRARYVTGAHEMINQDIPFGQYALQWFAAYKLGTGAIKGSTLQGYRSVLNQHILPQWGNRLIRTIKPIELQAWVNGFLGWRDGTVRGILLVTRQIFAQAFADGTIARNPMTGIHKPRTVEMERQEIPTEQLQALLNAAEKICPDPAFFLFVILYYTGLRRGEVLGLTWKDIDFPNRMIHVRQEVTYVGGHTIVYSLADGDTLKTKAAARDVPMPTALYRILLPYAGIGTIPVVHGRRNANVWLCESSYKRAWDRLLKAAKIDNEKLQPHMRVTPHRLRHTYSSITRRAKLDIKERQYIMGHADPEITDGKYTHINDEDKIIIMRKLDSVFGD